MVQFAFLLCMMGCALCDVCAAVLRLHVPSPLKEVDVGSCCSRCVQTCLGYLSRPVLLCRYNKHPGFGNDGITPDLWRKHWQWFSLIRKHAKVVADDKTIIDIFSKHCYTFREPTFWAPNSGAARECFSDEHYISTLLAMHGLDHETDCLGVNMHADWQHKDGYHPKFYTADETTPALINSLRLPLHGCNYDAAIDSANHVFKHLDTLSEGDCIGEAQPPVQWLGYQCPMFARKFPSETVSTALDMFLEQESHGVQLLSR